MASFQPVIVLFGSNKSISTINLRLPVSFILAIDETSLEGLITIDPQLSDACLQRYFVVLLESISDEVLEGLQTNHRVQAIYSRTALTSVSSQTKVYRIINKQPEQFTLDLTTDIVHFFTIEGEKQAKLERLNLARVYYRQARFLKEWAMAFVKAEPCHILVIPLNSNRENLDGAQERLQKLCTKLGYPSAVIRTLDNYISSTDTEKACLLPYSQTLFNYENPHYICELIKKLSPLRLYLYGNDEVISSEWSNLMISHETQVMEDEDSWCGFIENEYIDDDMKWNFGSMFGGQWKIKRLAPINLTELDKNLRFQSALRRAFKTFNPRQIEITAEIFDWYDKCLRQGYFQLEPKLSLQLENKTALKDNLDNVSLFKSRLRNPSSFRYAQAPNSKGLSFIWLDEILNSSDDNLNQIVEPFQWNFFNNVSQCLPFIENQLREQNEIFLVASGTLGYELFHTARHFMPIIRFVYIFCSRLGLHGNWIKYYSQIRGVFNESSTLGEKMKQDLEQVYQSKKMGNDEWQLETKEAARKTTTSELAYEQALISIPMTVYNREQRQAFMAHQRTIDTLLCLPFTNESRTEMIEEFRRIHHDNELVLAEIDIFNQTYYSNSAVQWYTRDSFVFRIVNKALRSSDADMMFKMRYFLTDLYLQLDELYRAANLCRYQPTKEKLYRGQIMSKHEFESFKQLQGQIIAINTFLSTTTSLQVALLYANSSSNDDEFLPIIFCIETNSYVQHKRPYANISSFSVFREEDEVLFSMGSLFHILCIERLDRMNNTPIIYLQMIDQKEIDYINVS